MSLRREVKIEIILYLQASTGLTNFTYCLTLSFMECYLLLPTHCFNQEDVVG